MSSQGYRDFRIAGRSGPRGRAIAVGILLVGLGLALYLGVVWGIRDRRALARAATLASEGRLEDALGRFRALLDHRLYGSSAQDGVGLVAALRGEQADAKQAFAAAGQGPVRLGALPWADLALGAATAGEYEIAETLARRGLERGVSGPVIHMSLGLALNGLDRLGEARAELTNGGLRTVFEEVRRGRRMLVGGVFRDSDTLATYTGHVNDLAQKERTQSRSYLLDHNQKPLFRLSIKSQQPLDVPSGLAVVVAAIDRQLTPRDRRGRVTTTVDTDVQKVANRALRGQRGAVVVLDLEGRVLAAAARDDRKRKVGEDPVPDPLATWFALGSVAKVPTLLSAASTPGALASLFPFSCDKPPKLDDRPFYDWSRHGSVVSVDDALAVSCNLAFAEIGLRLGRERLLSGLDAFGFARDASGAGQARVIGELATDTDLAELATGLAHTETTAVGAAAIALVIASGGEYREPYVIQEIATIGGKVLSKAEPGRRKVADAAAVAVVKAGMEAVVTSERGTARRARGELWTVAAKTGTTGNRKDGLDAVIVGFTPAQKPRYVFAAHLPKSGRSEWVAADVARQIVDGLQALDDDRARSRDDAW